MSVTPLFTDAELDTQIAAYKTALTALAKAQSYTLEFGATRQQLTRADLPEIRQTLTWLQEQRAATAGVAGLQSLRGRVAR